MDACITIRMQFTILSLSGGKPKKQNQIQSLSLSLGPDFMTDIVIVETSDHARLQIQVTSTQSSLLV
jgi:major vault protein